VKTAAAGTQLRALPDVPMPHQTFLIRVLLAELGPVIGA
jgi:hypothetical protein